MPDLLIEQGSVKVVSPIDISEGSGGQFALSESARSWTSLWLTMQAAGWTPATSYRSSLPVRVSFKNGSGSLISTLRPNPHFYELMMGWPIGWTAPEQPVTEFAAWLRRSRSQFSRLLTSWTAEQLDA